MHDIFISYSHADEFAARLIAQRLRDEGLSVFFDSQGLVAGSSWNDALSSELESADTVLAILSSNTTRSKWVQSEIEQALAREKRVIPILLDQHAKDNWLWPLLGTRQSLNLDIASESIRDQLDHLAQIIRGSRRDTSVNVQSYDETREHKIRYSAPSSPHSSPPRGATWRTAALSSVITVLVSALVHWLLSK